AHPAAAGVVLVGLAVAVVVEAVAGLARGLRVLLADDLAAAAGLGARGTDAAQAGAAGRAAAGVVLVGGAVAVVVEAVALFGRGRDVGLAGAPLTVLAALEPIGAGADVLGRGRPGVA